jgi:hypothetical protein
MTVRRICLTPVRNEAWIIKKFLAAVTSWADDVVIAEQGSADNTLALLQNATGVRIVINESPSYDEQHRQRLLIDRAREIGGRRILIALDADEALSANAMNAAEWQAIERAEPGTILRFRWVNILPGFTEAWIKSEHVAFGYVDDGCAHTAAGKIHNPRLPQPEGAPILDIENIVVLHFQFAIWDRMESKQRWYQMWEHLNCPNRSVLDIYRQYNHMYGSWADGEIYPFRPEWINGYDATGVDFRALECEPVTWWDEDLIKRVVEHGSDRFRRLAIWDKDWTPTATALGVDPVSVADPRSIIEKWIHRLLRATQKFRDKWSVRGFERILRLAGW